MKVRTKGINRKKTSWLLGQDLNVAITGICDVFDLRRERGKAASRREFRPDNRTFPEAKTYRNYQEMLKSKEIDAIIISTPDFSGRYMRLIQYYGDKYFNKIEKDVSTSFFCRMILNSV